MKSSLFYIILLLIPFCSNANGLPTGIGDGVVAFALAAYIGIPAFIIFIIYKLFAMAMPPSKNKTCPFCTEIIKVEAAACIYCHKDLSEINQKNKDPED